MESFQKIVLISAIVILILCLVFIGIALNSAKSESWPPLIPECPDFWIIDGSGNNQRCINMKDLGTCPAQEGQRHLNMNFTEPPFTGSNGDCAKYQWSKRCGVTWDGITYGVESPCITSS